MWQDVRFAIRTFAKSPGLTALVLATLGLGIGAGTAVFTIIHSVLLRPLPYKQPDRIVQVSEIFPATGGSITSSLPKYLFLRERARSFDALAAVSFGRVQVASPAAVPPAEVLGVRVSSNFFRVFGNPALGRMFLDAEERPGAEPVAIISDALWRTRFNGSVEAIGKTMSIDGLASTIVGVMPTGFNFPSGIDVWTPRLFEHAVITPVQIQRGASFLLYFARLAPSATVSSAEAEVATLSGQYDREHKGFGDTGRAMRVTALRESLVADTRRTLLVLLGAAAFVLLIASANVANFLLARGIARQKEMAVRASLGASRSRILSQLLTESLVLSGAGAVLGALLAVWSVGFVSKLSADVLPRAREIHVDATVLLFTAGVAVLTGVIFGLGPAAHSARLDLSQALKAAHKVSQGGRLRGAMTVVEVALAVVLLAGAGLLMRSFSRLQSADPGYRPHRLLAIRLGLAATRYPERQQQSAFFERALESAGGTPGVEETAVVNSLPVNGRAIGYFFNVEGRPALEPSKAPTFWLHSISPAYFRTLSIPLLRGRAFTEADSAAVQPVGIVNEGMARRFWPNEDPIGRHITYSRESITVQIVGVAADVKVGGVADNASYNELYVPYRQRPFLTMWLVVRGTPSAAGDARRAISAIDRDQPAPAVQTVDSLIAESFSTPRLRTTLIGAFAALALVLAVVGIAGIAAWSVSRRTHEIGIRMALGARPADILGMIVRQSLVLIVAGELIGLAGAFALTRFLSTLLFNTSPTDPATLAVVIALLAVAGTLAAALVGRRALRIDPAVAFRRE